MNKKYGLLAVFAVFLVFFSAALFADSSDSHGESVDTILSDIRSDLNLGPSENIEPDKVSDVLLEKLGEAVMSFRIPDPRQHEWMDKMMGGEGSESLANMHKLLGYRYLVNGSADFGSMMTGIGMYGEPGSFVKGFGGYSMEGRFGSWMPGYMFQGNGWSWIFPVLFLLVVIALAVVIILLAKRRRKENLHYDDPLTTLKERYAEGKMAREEFLRMKDELLEK